MRTLVISDLHLGSRLRRDVLRRPRVLATLLEALDDVDQLVLLGDVVEMLEGRAHDAMIDAEPVLRAIGDAMGRGRDILVVPGNHDHALVRPWLRARRERETPLGLATRVATTSGPELAELASWLRPARVRVQYPGAWLDEHRVYVHHGHYLDRHLIPGGGPATPASPDDYEHAAGMSAAAIQGVLATSLPAGLAEPLDRAAGLVRSVGLAMTPLAAHLAGGGALAPLSAGALGYQFRRRGLPAMRQVLDGLSVRADYAIFGHVHRAGPLLDDDLAEWSQSGGPKLLNTGCWVYEPLLLAGAEPPHPYWPGSSVLLEDEHEPRLLQLLNDVPEPELR